MLIKFALSEGSTAAIGVLPPAIPSTRRTAHKVTFDYEPKPGYIYVRSRAISSRCNDNFDEFPAEEIKKAYRTFIGKPVFVNHHNANHKRARGVIVDAALHEDVNPDGTPDTWTEVLMEVDAVRFPMLAKACLPGPNGEPPEIERTSMGTDVEYSVCSFCGNKAYTPVDYCNHIPRLKGQRIRRRTASGTTEDILVREICYGLGFFENSLLVEPPADPTAYTLGVDDRGLQMAASTSSRSRVAGRRHTHRSQRRVPDPTLGPITASKTAERVPVRSIEVGDQVKRATGEVVEVLRPPEEPPATERGPLENIGARFWGRYQGREGWMSYGSMDTEVERVHKYARRTARDDRQWTEEDEAKRNRANDGKFAPKGTDDGPKAEVGGERDREEAPKQDKATATDASQVEPYVPSKPSTGASTKDDPIVTDDVEAAVKALVENKHVNLSQPKIVTTVLGGVRQQVMAAIESGENLTVDLCNVTVKGTNLFCTESKGIPRIKMPQLTAKSVRPGSRAEKEGVRPDGDGFNIMPQFRSMLEERGITIEDTTEKAAYLKATQSELNAGKVSGMLGRLEGGGSLGDDSLFVSNDNYILDGHHRWAAQVAHDGADNELGNEYDMSIQRIDLDIISLYHEAMTFADEWGIETAGVGDVGKVGRVLVSTKEDCGCGPVTAEKKDPRFEGVSLKEDDDGWYVHTHRARSDSYPTPEDIPQSKVDFIESTGAKMAQYPVRYCKHCDRAIRQAAHGDAGDQRGWVLNKEDGSTVCRRSPTYFHEPKPEATATFEGREAAHLLAALEKGTPEYKKAYTRGWNSSERGSEGALERADMRGEPDAWYDGYMDSATGRPKWTLMNYDSPEAYYADDSKQAARKTAETIYDRDPQGPQPEWKHTGQGEGSNMEGEEAWSWMVGIVGAGYEPISELHGSVRVNHEFDEMYAMISILSTHGQPAVDEEREVSSPEEGRAWVEEIVARTWKTWASEITEAGMEGGPSGFPWNRRGSKTSGLRVVAYGEQVAPPKVDTLREEECPVCGETEAYDGGECRVCGFIRPPDDFMDPDLEKAREVDLRQDEAKADAEGDLQDGEENDQASDDPKGPLKIVKYTPSSKEGKTSRSHPASGKGTGTTGGETMDPTLKVLRAQQKTIEAQAARIKAGEKRLTAAVGLIKMIAKAAGIDGNERVASLMREADIDNPAQPVADKPAEAPAVTTEEAKTPAATTDVQSDQAVLTDVSPDAQTSLGSDETVLDEPLDLNEQDVEAPVSGLTQPGDDMKVETDVRGPDNPSKDTMDPWHLSSKQEQEARPIAAMRLARLRIQAGIADTDDDLDLSSRIAQDASLSAEAIASETATLKQVVDRQQQGNGQRTASRGLVPQRAADVPRLTPSFSPQATDRPLQTVGSVSADEIAFE